MASSLKNLSTYDPNTLPEASSMQFAVIVADWNAHITHALYQGCVDTLLKSGVYSDNIITIQVPGAFELTAAAAIVAKQSPKLNAIICLGCVIKGETTHNEYINHAVAQGLSTLSIQHQKPFIVIEEMVELCAIGHKVFGIENLLQYLLYITDMAADAHFSA